jgi:hypothetical protein
VYRIPPIKSTEQKMTPRPHNVAALPVVPPLYRAEHNPPGNSCLLHADLAPFQARGRLCRATLIAITAPNGALSSSYAEPTPESKLP